VLALHAGFIVLLAGPAMTLMGVVLWQGASRGLTSWRATWVTLAPAGLLPRGTIIADDAGRGIVALVQKAADMANKNQPGY
jgi:hypothetical protein